MKTKYNKKLGVYYCIPETPLEAVEELEEFFIADMWYAKHAEWKKENDMLKYLHAHFKICKEQIKRIMKNGQTTKSRKRNKKTKS